MGALPYTVVEELRLNGEPRFLLWQSDMELSGESALFRETRNSIPTFPTVDDARAYAQRAGLTTEREIGAHVYDIDAIRKWCQDPQPANLNAKQLFMAWRLLEDAGLIDFPNALAGEPDYWRDELATWLTTHLTETDKPPPGWEPHQWTSDEAQALAGVLRPHLEQLLQQLRRPAA